MRKTLLLLLLLSSLRLLFSCCKDVGYDFRWTKASLRPLLFTGNGWQTAPADSIRKEVAGLLLRFDHEKLATLSPDDFGTNKALATKCIANYTNKDTLMSANLVTRFAFDNTHPAGSSLNDLPLVVERAYLDTSRNVYLTLNEFLHAAIGPNQSNSPHSELVFRFARTNPIVGQHRFVITFKTASGRVLEDSVSIRFY